MNSCIISHKIVNRVNLIRKENILKTIKRFSLRSSTAEIHGLQARKIRSKPELRKQPENTPIQGSITPSSQKNTKST